MIADLPRDVIMALELLESSGFEAFLVGGCVRDRFLGLEPVDYDITTRAEPSDLLRVFSDYTCIQVGVKYGTVAVVFPTMTIEITTYRKESDYVDSRHPSEVHFTKNLTDDLSRRDFTMNAMAWNPSRGLVDPFSGREDLKSGILRTVGAARERLAEDALRILRGIRFASVFSLTADASFLDACKAQAADLLKISAERIRIELDKMLLSKKPSVAIRLMEETEVLPLLLPEISGMIGFSQDSPYHHLSLYDHTLCVLDQTEPILPLRWAALLHDAGKLETKVIGEDGIGRFYGHDKLSKAHSNTVLQRLKAPNERIEEVGVLIERHMANCNPYSKKSLKRLMQKMPVETLEKLFLLQEADCRCASNQGISNIAEGRALLEEILTKEEPYLQNQLAIDGNDLLAVGIPEGKEIGHWLRWALETVSENPDQNHKKILLQEILSQTRRK